MKDKKLGTGIVFGRWRLIPLDTGNWELAKLRDSGKWSRLGRYYQYNTFANAIRYAADAEGMDGCSDSEMEMKEYLDRYESIVRGLRESFAG